MERLLKSVFFLILGSGLIPGTRGPEAAAAAPAPNVPPYRESWAAIIAIDDYSNWPQLRYASNDALALKDLLIEKYNFKPDHIFTLLNKEASRQNILSLLGDKLANPDLVQREDRVLVFYAGHGATRRLASGRELGYIIPVDADLTNYEGSAISMTNFQDISEAIPAKHVLFFMDSCYSGLALVRGGSPLPAQNYLNEMAHREARQMFTAGGADQQVADSGPNGHSVFTWTLLQGLDGRADLNGDGVITATELAAYVAPAVSALSHQTPAFGSLPGSEGGDFIFELKHETEFLNQDSAQLGEEGIKLNAELEELRAQMRQESRQNEELRAQLEAARAQLKQGASSAAPTAGATASAPADPTAAALVAPRVDAPVALNAEAAVKFIEMSIAQPASALTAQASSTSAWESPLRPKMMSSAGVVPPVVANREVAPGYILPDVFATWREEIRKSTAGEITRQLAADAILVKEMTIRHMKLAEESAKGLWWSPCGFNGSAQSELTIDDCGLPIGSAPFSFAFSL